jgi:serine/threonine protein kinase
VWACGIILYIILVGKLPFFGEFEADLFRKIQSGKHMPLPTDIGSTKLRGLLSHIFTVDPKMRISAD